MRWQELGHMLRYVLHKAEPKLTPSEQNEVKTAASLNHTMFACPHDPVTLT